MSKKISRTLIGGRSVITGRAGQALKLGAQGRLHWKDIGEVSLNPKWYGSRGVWPGGWTATNQISYITISSTGNAIDFGNLTVGRSQPAGACNFTRGLVSGGTDSGTNLLTSVETVEIASTGNAVSFGEMSLPRNASASSSDSHGGLGGY